MKWNAVLRSANFIPTTEKLTLLFHVAAAVKAAFLLVTKLRGHMIDVIEMEGRMMDDVILVLAYIVLSIGYTARLVTLFM